MTENNRKNPPRSGFTLIEVMIVLFILVMLAGMAVLGVRGSQARAQKQTALTNVRMLKSAVDLYTVAVGRPPSAEQGLAALVTCPSDVPEGKWSGPYIEATAKSTDPWDNEYQYAYPGKNGGEFDIWSYGPDMMDGTEDDIGSWMNDI
jgi:general secretion pathway protein G